MSDAPLLELSGYGVAFGERVVLADVCLDVPERGILVIVGPGGAGKSTLLRTLTGANEGNPSMRTWGSARFAGEPLGSGEVPVLVAQNARLLIGTVLDNLMWGIPERSALTTLQQMDVARRLLALADLAELGDALGQRILDFPLGVQRRLAVVRTTAPGPRMLCVDEPTADLTDAEAEAMVRLLRREGERRAVAFVTHNQRHARAAGGITALLAGGRIHEHGPTEELFTAALTRAAQQFARTGSCDVPSPGAPAEDLAEGVEAVPVPPAARTFVSDGFGPRGFRWMKKGALGGTPRPGIIDETEHDLEALRRVGTTVLVTLETDRFPEARLAPHGIRGVSFPVDDMKAPSIAAAQGFCAEVARLLAAGEVVVLHCRAGLGRTGTMLAAQLIHEGSSALAALEAARRVEPRWVQSEEQVEFLERFARARSSPGEAPPARGGPASP